MHESFTDIALATYTKLAAKKVLEIFSSQMLCIEFFSEQNSYLIVIT